ncbi:hypothetical protein [Lysobacter terrae]
MAITDDEGSDEAERRMEDRKGPIAELLDLLGGDVARVLRVIEPYRQAASDNLLRLDAALRDGNVEQVREVAYEMAMACYLVGEREAARQLGAILQVKAAPVIDPVMAQSMARGRTALLDSIVHMELEITRLKAIAAQPGFGTTQ